MSRWPRLPERQAAYEHTTAGGGVIIGSGWMPPNMFEGIGVHAGVPVSYEAMLALDERVEKKGLGPDAIAQFALVSVSEEHDCSICLEAFQKKKRARRLPCGHAFHPLCIGKWFKEHIVCPLCRFNCHDMAPSTVA